MFSYSTSILYLNKMSTLRRIKALKYRCTKKEHLIKLIIFAVAFLNVLEYGSAIQCFKCAVTVEKNHVSNTTITTPMCSKFDESEEFIVDCPFSTMCLKTISTLHLQNGQKQETITRGCAQQKDTTQVFRNRQWQQEHSVQEVYEEGCGELKENNLAGAVRTHCYCRGAICNTAAIQKSTGLNWCITLIAMIFILFSALR